ncbi:FAD-linked oxidoreductase azaL [Lasiodiplodia theobromae]|uniref:FAD-linked oxidoreductase azaL n=1 Tax=Lasiodiplodia theobromae TaxID=45133 RepID=A0A5N5D8E0_9PEZI|nr:FAD-linked oxidoreductase azaL [Lasiodiplodia theobromae]
MVRSLLAQSLALGGLLTSNIPLASALPQNDGSAALQTCLTEAVGGDASRAQFPSEENFSTADVKPYNRQYQYTPSAVMYPKTATEVGDIVKCASKYTRKVQARSGGHDYVNKGIGGANDAVVVDLKNFNQLSVNQDSGIATIGPANGLKAVVEGLNNNGQLMIPHGTSATVGIGGHTLIGGFGPVTRRSGLALDSLREVEVVLANGTVTRASEDTNADLFWAMRGAGQSFGIATSFDFQTSPQPTGNVVTYQYNVTNSDSAILAETLASWQTLISDPDLSRDLFTLAVYQGNTLLIRGNYWGSRADFEALRLAERVPNIDTSAPGTTLTESSWIDMYEDTFRFTDTQLQNAFFYARTAAVTKSDLPSNETLAAVLKQLHDGDAGHAGWWVLIDINGGAVADVAVDATAFPHRDALYYFQIYVSSTEKEIDDAGFGFVDKAMGLLQEGDAAASERYGVYPGYPDARLNNPQQKYWGSNLPRLEKIKAVLDPEDVFSTAHGVKPARS